MFLPRICSNRICTGSPGGQFRIVASTGHKNQTQPQNMNLSLKNFTRLAALTGLFLATVLFFGGCASADKPASASFTSVIISNHTPQQIRDATDTVFQQNGYQAMGKQDDALVYERQATGREQRDYAGFVGAHEGEKVDIRVRVKIEVKDPSSYWANLQSLRRVQPRPAGF